MRAMYNTVCPECNAKLERSYISTPVEGTERWGVCKLCGQPRILMQYEHTPRKTWYRKARPGGGERARAGGKP